MAPITIAAAADAGIENRVDVKIPAGDDLMAGWHYPSRKYTAATPGPAIVLAHGLGGTKELRLDVFASKFNDLGYTCLAFDYRCNGASTGLPRGLIDWSSQQQDWHTALAWIRSQENVDANKVGVFGTSFGGGHVIQLGATDHRLKAVIAQCPFTDGWASALCTGIFPMTRLFILGLMDLVTRSDTNPYRVSLVGAPGETALMNAPDVLDGFYPLIPYSMHKHYFTEQKVPARLVPTFPFNRPGIYARNIQCPVFFSVCGKDSVAPAKNTLAYAKQAPKGVVKLYEDMGHFDIYLGEKHETVWKEYVAFMQQALPV